jgi:predicted secreted protein
MAVRRIQVLRSFLFAGVLVLGATCKKTTSTTFTKTFGGTRDDLGTSVEQTSDGGYIAAGYTTSYGAGGSDVWLVKTDSLGTKTWDTTFGGAGSDEGYSVEQTTDGGYIIAGTTASHGAGGTDVWLVKADASGKKLWDKTFGGPDDDGGSCVRQTSDRGYVITGYTKSYGAGGYDVWLIKTDSTGNKAWDTTFGGTGDDWGASVEPTTDGGYVVTGYTTSYGAGGRDLWLIKTDASGNKVWDKTYGGAADDEGASVQPTTDGGYIVAGSTLSYGAGSDDVWLVKTDGTGALDWDTTFGGTGADKGRSVVPTSDGGYIVTGYTSTSGAGGEDLWLVKTDAEGN